MFPAVSRPETCDEAIHKGSYSLELVPGSLKTQEMCIKEVKDPWDLEFVPMDLITQEMCDDAVCEDPHSLQFFPY